jgi:hypothetical protein
MAGIALVLDVAYDRLKRRSESLRKITTTLGDAVIDMARHKHAAGLARREPDPSVERPGDVAFGVFAQVASDLAREGFASLAKGRRLVRRAGDLTYEVSFQSDRNNIAGKRVAVWAHALVASRSLAQWRKQHGSAWGKLSIYSGGFAGGQIGNLRQPHSWMEWDFADPADRAATVADLLGAIRQIILPFFEQYRDASSALDAIVQDDGVSLWLSPAIEFAHLHFGREGAERVGRAFLAKHPSIREPFLELADTYRRDGIPDARRGGWASELAAMAVFLQLDLAAL